MVDAFRNDPSKYEEEERKFSFSLSYHSNVREWSLFFRLTRAFKRRIVIERDDGHLVWASHTKCRLRLMERGFAPVSRVLVSIKLAVWIRGARDSYFLLV